MTLLALADVYLPGEGVVYKGVLRSVSDLASEFHLVRLTLLKRLQRGMSVQEALTAPALKGKPLKFPPLEPEA